MHKPRIGIHPARLLFVRTIQAPTCELRQAHTLTDSFVCQEDGCRASAQPVYQEAGSAIVGWLCAEHVATAGYCNHCGVYEADKAAERTTLAFYGRCQACTETLFQ